MQAPTRALHTAGSALHDALLPTRLLLAAKTAVAVAIAWVIAPLMPGVVDEYPYYAPLGALVSMYPTLMNSLRSSVQTLLGLAAGIALAAAVVLTAGPNVVTIAVVVGIGILISGTGWFGVGQDYVPMAAMFVLIVGGARAEDYSIGYLVQMAVGVAVGLTVNLVIPPAPLTAEAITQIDSFQRQLSAHLHGIADALTEEWPPQHSEWVEDATGLAETSSTLRAALAEADESRRGNPRAWLRSADTREAHARLAMLDEIAHQIRDISGSLGDTLWDRASALPLASDVPQPMAAACRAVADALIAGDEEPARTEQHDAAREAVDRLVDVVRDSALRAGSVIGADVLVGIHLRRILMLLDAPRDDD